MDETRAQAYANLIQQLLTCPGGEEPQLLQANSELIDGEFLQVCQIIAENLAGEGQENAADFLRNMASQLGEFLGFTSSRGNNADNNSPRDYLDFLQLLVQIEENNFGEDSHHIYMVLQANIDKINLNLISIIRTTMAGSQIERNSPEQTEKFAALIENIAIKINKFPRGNRAENIEIAIAAYEIVLSVRTFENNPERWAQTQSNMANAYSVRIKGDRTNNIEQAIFYYQEALKVRTRDAFPEQWATTQNNLAAAYYYIIRGDKAENIERAIAFFKVALEIRNRNDYPKGWAETNNNLGEAYRNRILGERGENIEQAITFYNAALKVYTRYDFPERWAETQNNLGEAYRERIREEREENIEQAITFYNAALQVHTREAFPEYWATTQNNLAIAYCQRIRGEEADNIEQAIELYHNALTITTREAFPQNNAETLSNLGDLYHSNQQWQLAYDTFSPAIETVEFLRGEIQSGDESKKKLAEEWNQLYQRMVEVCLELAKGDLQYYTKAIEYAERSKARNLVELLANKDIYPKNDFYPNSELYQTHCHQLEQVRRQIPAKQRELEILISNRESEETYRSEIEQRRQELNQLQQQRDELLAEISQIDSKFAFTQTVKTIPFSNIQSLIDENTAIIEWYITGSQILTFIITRYHPHPIVVNSENMTALENWDKEYRDSYQKQNTQWINNLASRLQNLAEILHIDDIISRIDECFAKSGAKCNRLILIPHRYLHLFPLHTLPLADGKLLFERFSQGVGYAPSCQLLKQAKDQEQNRPDFTRLFAIQNPTIKKDNGEFHSLIGSQLEIDKIRQPFDPEQSTILKEAEATEANIYQCMEQMRSSHCLHFSCHGKFNLESPLKSALLLADPEGKLGEEANLTLGEVFEKLYLNQCRLVTFSACESGMTDRNSISDEYIGLPSGFLYAGSLSVVSTLWRVDPIATTLLMVKFYQNLKRLPQIKTGDVAIALNKAQKWLRSLTNKKLERIQHHPKFKLQLEQAFENQEDDLDLFNLLLNKAVKTKKPDRYPYPFAKPYYWSAFVAIGV